MILLRYYNTLFRLVPAAFLLLGLARFATAGAAATLTLSQAALGNIFSSSQTVQIPVTTSGDHVCWTTTDFYGNTTTGGPTAVTNGSAVVLPSPGKLGYFAITINALSSGSVVATASTTFSVVAPGTVSPTSTSPFGVCTHFSQGWPTDVMSIMALGGISQFRDEQYWSNLETTQGVYNFSSFTPYMSAAAAAGLNPLIELDFGNTLYGGGSAPYGGGYTPYNTTGYTGFGNYTAAVLNQFDQGSTTQVQTVEIWNEYNGTYCTGPATSNEAADYTSMLQAAYTAAKAVNTPNSVPVTVLGGACVPISIPWFQSIFSAGALPYMDAAVVHPYRAVPEGVEVELAALETLIQQSNDGTTAKPVYGVTKPIWATEFGSSDTTEGRQTMASYLVRQATLMLTAYVQREYWYLLYDETGYANGLIRAPGDALGTYVPTSAFNAYSTLIQQLNNSTYVARESTDPRTRFYHFSRTYPAADVRVLWSTEGTAQLVLTTSAASLTLIDIMGNATTLTPTNGLVAVTGTINPSYVIGPVSNVLEIGRDTLVADSVAGYSSTQGTAQGSWQYNYCVGPVSSSDTTFSYAAAYDGPLPQYSVYGSEYAWNGYYSGLLIDQDGEEPSNYTYPAGSANAGTTVQIWPVRRWVSNVAGTATIVGTASRSSPYGDGTGIMIYVDNVLYYSVLLTGTNGANFSFTAPIKVGSNVDMIATPGPAISIDYDYVAFEAQISVAGATPTTYASWQGQNFTAAQYVNPAISGSLATPAGDGVPNLLKYAANLSATAPLTKPLVSAGVQGTTPGSMYLTLTCQENTAATDLTFTPQVNAGALGSPAAWQSGGTIYSTTANGNGTSTVIYEDTVPIGSGAPERFMRLQVTGP